MFFPWLSSPSPTVADYIAYGIYKITNSYNDLYFYIDFRDCKYDGSTYPCTYYNPDFFIRFNNTEDEFQWRRPDMGSGNWFSISTGEILTVWDMRNNGTPPTTSEFENYWSNVLVVLTDGNNPRIVWGPHPTFDADYYKVHRAVSSTPLTKPELYAIVIATVSSSTYEYRDTDISLTSNGNYIYYFVKGYNGSYSGRSNIGLVRGYFYKENLSDDDQMPGFSLNQNYPNPFNPSTKIFYTLPKDAKVQIRVYDMLGREVAVLVNELKQAGYYETTFDASELSGGIYLYRITSGTYSGTKKMILLK